MKNKKISITIPIEPRTKKNSQQIILVKGRPLIMPSKQYKAYEKECAAFMPKLEAPIDYLVNIECKYYLPTRRKCDLTNLLEATDDILVKYGVIQDDNYSIIYSHDNSRVYYNKDNPRTEIIITPIDDEKFYNDYLNNNYEAVYQKFCESFPERIHSDFIIDDLDFQELCDFLDNYMF